MPDIAPTSGEELARRFHDTYERLAPEFGYETRTDTREFDPQSSNGRLMIAVCKEIGCFIDAEKARADRVEDAFRAFCEGLEMREIDAIVIGEPDDTRRLGEVMAAMIRDAITEGEV